MPLILLVEDDVDILEAMSALVESAGYSVAQARNGQLALEQLRRAVKPSLIMLDLQMPVMNGWQVLDYLRADQHLSKIPVIVLSASDVDLDVLHGARDLIKKPAEAVDIMRTLRRWCPQSERGALAAV